MIDIRKDWFHTTESQIKIKCDTVNLLPNKEDAICYILALNKYNLFQPRMILSSYVVENNSTGYLLICGDNTDTKSHIIFILCKGE